MPERIELERRALGPYYIEEGPIIRARPGESLEALFGNIPGMRQCAELLVEKIRSRLVASQTATQHELMVYEDLSLYVLYSRVYELARRAGLEVAGKDGLEW